MKYIQLANDGGVAIVDDKDYDDLIKLDWHNNKGYARNTKYRVYMHRYLLKPKPHQLTDHKNHNTLDNRRENIRICTNSENQKNKKARGVSKYLGVALHKTKSTYVSKKTGESKVYSYEKWMAHITVKGKILHLGLFKEEKDAAIAYNEAAKKHHGEFANLNVI